MVLHSFLLSFLTLFHTGHAYVDFEDLTKVKAPPAPSIPRPHRLPSAWPIDHHRNVQHSVITALAPFLTMHTNGTHVISWSTTHYQYSHHFQNARGVFKRQNGVFRSDTSLLATCTPCNSGVSNNTQTATDKCYPATNSGILNGAAQTNAGTFCYPSNYNGALRPVATTTGLPCCPTCTPVANATLTITGGVLAPVDNITTITQISSTTVTITSPGSNSGSVTTMTSQTSTVPTVTLSVTTILPTITTTNGGAGVIVSPATVVGCGTASGSGTVVGSGTVFLGPGGIFPVTSSGTVSGFASKVIGCGTIIATTGSFEGSAAITGCGTGTGCAVLTGIGTVFPNALGGFVGISSSGVASGCGKVIGCGTLIGTGTFSITAPYTTVPKPRSTVNVYISYCPPDPLAPFRIAGMVNETGTVPPHLKYNNATYHQPFYAYNGTNANGTRNGTSSLENPLCQVCPNDSGICCPLYAACGADGHCPYTALEGAGYLRYGWNVVECGNSSTNMGMVGGEARLAPGLPGPSVDEVIRKSKRGWYGHVHGHRFGNRRWMWQ